MNQGEFYRVFLRILLNFMRLYIDNSVSMNIAQKKEWADYTEKELKNL